VRQIRPWLFVGSQQESADAALLADHGIGAMLLLHAPVEVPGVTMRFLPVTEGERIHPAEIATGIAFALDHQDARVLIACGVGISRSVTFAVAALHEAEGCDLVTAFSEVRKAHPAAMPDEIHWKSLCAYFGEDVDFWDLWQQIEL
jgi:protein tyrosine phosphatase (PTP) superfamily phosphohydrolase (DUF442 family)